MLNLVLRVHAQGGLDYTLSNSGGVTLVPGGSGSTRIIAILTAGTASNVTLSCDLTNLPAGTTCSFSPTSVIPGKEGNASSTTRLIMTVPATTPYSAFNVTVTAKAGSPAPLAPTIFALTVAAKIAVNPTANASKSYGVGTSITVAVNVTYSPPFSGFTGALFFNETVLKFQGVDYSGGVFGNDALVASECLDLKSVDGSGNPCFIDKSYDQVGVFSLQLFTNSGKNTTTPTGTSFSVTFAVVSTGFSAIHFVQNEVQTVCDFPCTTVNIFRTVAYDGYFTNMECGTGNLCKPPVVSFTVPLRPTALRPASFDATALSLNPNGRIIEYNWTWGSGLAKQYYNSPPPENSTKLETNATFTFSQIGENSVSLRAQDNYGADAYYTLIIDVIRVWVDLGIGSVSINPQVGVVPGITVHIVATATNNGVNPDNSTLRLSINNRNVATQPVMNLGPLDEASMKYDWNTAGLAPRAYRVDVRLDEVRNATTGQLLENDTAIINGQRVDPNNARVAFVQLIAPLPAGFGLLLGLNLPETISLGLVVIAAIAFSVGLVRKSRSRIPEPL